jgi:RND family efflux transporter MFP subunit
MSAGTVTLNRSVATVAGLGLLIAGGFAAWLAMRFGERRPQSATAATSTSAPATLGPVPFSEPTSSSEVVLRIDRAVVARAGIRMTPVSAPRIAPSIRATATVEANGYATVAVSPQVAGRVTRVLAELGQRVRRGQPLAQIYSPDLAEAETRLLAARARLDAHDRELRRTEALVRIGAASRQELERIHAEHSAQSAEVESARARLELLGVPAPAIGLVAPGKAVEATTTIVAPIDGVVTERLVNTGAIVDALGRMFVVTDLSTVWVMADLVETDVARAQIGAEAVVTTRAYPGVATRGRIAFIEPRVADATRTVKARIEVANPRGELRPGMYAEVSLASPPPVASSPTSAPLLAVPKGAIQTVGDRQVVYVASANDPERFAEREVRIGQPIGDQVEILGGLAIGEAVVSDGAFFLRAEVDRRGLRQSGRPPTLDAHAATVGSAAPAAPAPAAPIVVLVTEKGFEPSMLAVPAGASTRVIFRRTTDRTCAREVVFPAAGIRRALPLNEPVEIQLAPSRTPLAFVCGMKMFEGSVVAR